MKFSTHNNKLICSERIGNREYITETSYGIEKYTIRYYYEITEIDDGNDYITGPKVKLYRICG